MGGTALHRGTERLGPCLHRLGWCWALSYVTSHAGATRTSGTSWHQRGKGQSGASRACCQGIPLKKMSLFWPVLLQILGSLQSGGMTLLPSLLRPELPVSPETSLTWQMCHIGAGYILQPWIPRLGSQEPLNLISLLCRESRVSLVQLCPSYKMGTLVWFICPAQLERRESLGPLASGCLGSR